MKRLFALFLCVFLLLGLAACGGKKPDTSDPNSDPQSLVPTESSEPVSDPEQSTTPSDSTPISSDGSGTVPGTTTKNPSGTGTTTKNSGTTPTNPNPVKVTKSLNNTHYKLTVDKKLTVGYIGGSVTVGVGASDQSQTSWRALTTQWLKKTYPSATIQEGNAAISGTGSLLGACRIQNELLEPYHPDLVFIEFAINDYYQGCLYDESVRNMESMVRMTLTATPNADIVLLYTTDSSQGGQDFDAILAFEQVAQHYGLYSVNLGKTLVEREGSAALKSGGTYLTDIVHPTDAGYAKYASYVTEFLSQNLKGSGKLAAHTVPSPIRNDYYKKSTPIDAAAISKANPGVGTLSDSRNLYLKNGNMVTVEFQGPTLAMWWSMKVNGKVTLRMDGKKSDLPEGNPDGAQKVIYQGLSNAKHTLKIANMGTVNCSLRSLYVLE